jgi:hypothetical protein
MATEVLTTDEFERWFLELSEKEQDAVDRYIGLLAEKGVTLGHPYSSTIIGSKLPLRELRVQAKGKPIRAIYAFDPERNAVMLIGGDKTGDDRFYERIIPQAERIFREYLAEHEGS